MHIIIHRDVDTHCELLGGVYIYIIYIIRTEAMDVLSCNLLWNFNQVELYINCSIAANAHLYEW